jgi:hypothetical protein
VTFQLLLEVLPHMLGQVDRHRQRSATSVSGVAGSAMGSPASANWS